MNPELQQQAASFLEATKQAGSNAAQFLQEQAPQYVAEVIRWQFWHGALTCMVAGVVVAVSVKVFLLCIDRIKKEQESYNGNEEGYMILAASSFLCGAIAAVFFASGLFISVKAKVAPRVVIVEHAARLIGK